MSSDLTLTNLSLAERRRLLKIALSRDLERKGSELRPIERASREERLPLSFAQQRLWFLEQLGDLGSTYHIAKRLRLHGPLDRVALGRALDGIVARHEVLRTTFAEVAGVPEQRIASIEDSVFPLVQHDLGGQADWEAELGRLTLQEARARFDLERGPLVRGRLIRLGEDDHVLLLTMHHIVSDGWSTGVFFGELAALYGAHAQGTEANLAALPVQYADFAVWQRQWVEGDVLRQQVDYWTRTLTGAPELLEVPADRPRPAEIDHTGARVDLALDAELTAGLKALSRRHGATLYMTLLAGWAVVLGRLSGVEDVVVGTPTAGRRRPEVEGLIGFFVNTLALRLDLSGGPTVAELLGRVKERVLDGQHHQDIPFEQVVERVDPVRSMSHHPLFQVLFAWQNTSQGDGPGLRLPGLAVGQAGGERLATAKLDLSLSMWEAEDRIVGGVTYSTALFERATVERYAGYLRRVLREMAADEDLRVDRLSLMAESERVRVLEEWNRTEADYPRESCIHTLFEAQVERTPDAVAVVYEGDRLTYAELDRRANRLAHHLRSLGVGPDVRVAICVERGLETMVGLLAILKAGGAYVPLDPDYPAERLGYMLADSAPAAVLTQQALRDRVEGAGVPVLELDAAAPAWASEAETNPARGAQTPEHAAYVIYTSGSTGMPKGVVVPHRAVVSQLAWAQRTWTLGAHEAVLQRISLSFDVSVRELFWALTVGARVVLAGPAGANDPAALVAIIAREGIGAIHSVPTLLQAFLEHPDVGSCTTLSRVMCGGEVLSPALARRFHERLPNAALYHMYGPTETTVAVTAARSRPEEQHGRLPLGRPIANTRAYVLDARGEPVPVGAAGELCIGGAQLSRGYLGRAELTAERFVADPFAGEPGARMYRTGDRVRWLPGGELEFLGRTDHQVKLRGFRIELGEIEARLLGHPAVREAVVLVREDAPGEKRLVAYVVGDEVGADVLRAQVSETLPEYMVPAAYVRLDVLPLTPNGKVDRKALPAPEGDAYAVRAYEPPAGDVEEILAGIWAEVLGVERVGRRDHFFELGGHSLLAVQVISRVRQGLRVEVALGELFTRPVLGDFARELEMAARAALPPIEPAPRGDRLPLSFAQQRLWFLEQLGNLGSTYHVSKRLRLRGSLDRAALVRALDGIVARHEALRTVFAQVNGVPEQRIAPADAGFHLVEHDLGGRPGAEAELGPLMAEEAGAPFDLERGPLIRGRLVRLADDDHVLLLTMHHIVSDAWSAGVLTGELSALYGAFLRGQPDPLSPLPVQYADYAAWQRRWVESEALQAQADYWTRTLSGAPELLELPTDHPRPARQDFAGANAGLVLDEALTAGLKALSQRHGTTLFMTVLAGWAMVLSRLSGQADLVVGTPSANRGRREIEGLIGFFVNTLALRVDLSDAPTVAEVLARVKARALEAQHHQDIPFEQVVELVQPARSLAHAPLFQVMFAWKTAPATGGLALPGLKLASAGAASRVTAKFDLMLSLGEAGGRIAGGVEYATSLFAKETVERWLGYLRRVLEAMAADDVLGVDRLPMLPEAERRLVLREFNDTRREYPREACVHELFEAQAARTPGAVAVVSEAERVTYAELNARANRLAHHLKDLGVAPDVRVGICVERSVEMVVGLLAVLKAGGAYVPLDAGYPVDRLRNMLEDSAPAVLLTHPPLAATVAELVAGSAVPVLDIAADAAWAAYPETNSDRDGLGPENLAHVLFTSGSTGRPKGVMLEHGSLVNRLAWMQDRYGMEPHEALLQKTPFSFDVSFWEFFWPLMVGARLVMARPGGHRDPRYLAEVILREGVTVAHFVPSMLSLFLEHPDAAACTGLVRVPVSGEAVSAALARQFHERLPGVGLFNQYGPTESGEVTEWECPPGLARVSIGRAIHNSAVYVLDRAGEPVPVGVAGELFIGGVAVARGYLGRPRLTAERFVPDPFGEPGARMYRTGDLCRWLESAGVRECVSAEANPGSEYSRTGVLEYLGRNDFQVKIRGFRVEMGDIESRLVQHPAVREAAVVAREESPGDRRLVAYYVADEPASVEALRAHLGETLPEYMVPAAFVHLDAWPLTPTGKLDRKALPAPAGDAFATRGYEAPVTDAEAVVAEIWAELLHAKGVGRHDHFFELGGHSLLAVQVISRVRQVLGVEVELGELFARPVLSDFARALETASRSELPPIEPADREGRLPLSFAQQRLWFLEQLGGLGAAYHIPLRLRLRGELDRGALARALDGIVARHETLRTTFAQVDGVPEQRVAPADAGFHLVEHDLGGRAGAEAELDRLVAGEAEAPFDLERGPLIRGRLIRLAADDHVLLVTMHHVVSDGWSMGVLTGELSALYAAHARGGDAGLPALPVQYADYAAWQRRWVDGDVLREQAEYWTHTLTGAPELLALPTDRPRPARIDHAGGVLALELDAELTAGLKALSRRHGTTLYMTLMAAWAVVLGRLSGQDDVVIGTPTAGRGRREIEGLIGFFVNTLAVRVNLSDAPTVAELLGRVKERTLGAQHHQDIPFEQVVERLDPTRSLSHAPLFQVMFTWQNAPRGAGISLPGLEVGGVGAESMEVRVKFDLSLTLRQAGDRIVGALKYATSLLDRATVERWAGYLRRVLEEMVADESRRVERLPLLPPEERARVVDEWNRTDAPYPGESCVHELFQAQVARAPHALAVVHEDGELTYAELNARSNRLAYHLIARGVGPDVCVGLCLERGPEMIVALMAVLKAGGAYVPLDPDYPGELLAYMLEDSAPAVLLTQSSLAAMFADSAVPRIRVDSDAAQWADAPATDPARGGLTPDHLVYVIYTSGSTGRPKGVMNQHRALMNRLTWGQRAWSIDADETLLCKTSLNFDGSVREILLPLMAGGRVVIAGTGGYRDPSCLLELIGRHRITTVNLVPSLLQMLLDAPEMENLRHLRRVLCGGEALPGALLERFRAALPGVELHNLYGPSEAATAVTAPRLSAQVGDAAVPIGGPSANARVYVLDGAGEPVPVGVAGELYIGGVPVARGYLGRAALTAERFVPDGFGGRPGARMYRTGDVVRWLVDGWLEFVGRNDDQVKVRGFRVELGEIEARLREHAAVRQAVVVAREDVPGDRRLVAYCVADAAVESGALRAHVAARLPEYMVPSAYVRLDALPLTPNGKVDRRALPAPDPASAARAYEAPVGHIEQALAEIWSEVLRVERVGRHDDFFELGGHSLLAVQVVSRVRQALGVEIALGEVFARPVLGDFALEAGRAARAELPPIERVPRDGSVPLSFAQQRLWFLEQLGNQGSTYHIPHRLRLRGALDRGALARALDAIVARHEVLRTTFTQADGIPEQRIAPADAGFLLREHDLGVTTDADAELDRLMADEAGAPFDLERGPLIRGRLIRLAEDDHVLMLTMHHIVSDGWSMGVLTGELSAHYAAHVRGTEAALAELPLQYADYAAWQRRWVDGDVLREQADYWTRTLGGAPELLALPTDRPRPARMDPAGARVGMELDAATTAALKALGRRHGTTLFMTLLAGWAVVLARLSGQEDVVVGTPMAGRGRREIEGLIGLFVNTLALRLDVSGTQTVAELLGRARARALEAQHHQDIPFEQVVELVDPVRSLAHNPLFQAMFTWQNAPSGDGVSLPGLTTDRVRAGSAGVQSKYDLSLTLWEADEGIRGGVTFAAALFEPATVERWVGYLGRVLREMAADPARRLDRLPLLPEGERALVVEEWNRTAAPYPAESCIHECFEAQAARTPDAVALVSAAGERVTYGELNRRANRLAHHLRARGVGPDVRVGLCVERSPAMVEGLLGILKAGGVFVPLDPGYPRERLEYMLADSAPAAVLAQGSVLANVAATLAALGRDVPVLELDAAAPAWADAPETDPGRGALTPAHPAYVTYTSGSTGRPKGVPSIHHKVLNLVHWYGREFGITERDSVLLVMSFSFDGTYRNLFAPLFAGGQLHLAGEPFDPAGIVAQIAAGGVCLVNCTPSAFQALAEADGEGALAGLRTAVLVGEAVQPRKLMELPEPRPELVNLYGPTECSGIVTFHRMARDLSVYLAEPVPVGRPIPNGRIYLLDRTGSPVPIGVAGELHIGGTPVGRGYQNAAGQTAEKFVPDPFGGEPGARLYRTGDRARWRPDGTIEFLGRLDTQVKVRGYRIEPGEIEARLTAHDAVREAVVLVREDTEGEPRLVAYWLGEAVEAEPLRAHLAEALPAYMVPAAYVRVEQWPLTPNGKLDRRALPAPEGDAYAARAYEAPADETEQALAEIWAEVLRVERVGRWDNFFELGGHSLSAVQVISRVRQVLEVRVALGDVFTRPVLKDFAQEILDAQLAQVDPEEMAQLMALLRESAAG